MRKTVPAIFSTTATPMWSGCMNPPEDTTAAVVTAQSSVAARNYSSEFEMSSPAPNFKHGELP